MAYPTDPPNHTGASPAALAGSRLTPEDAEKLAATFRPSWELDDAPFAPAAAFSDAGVHALRGGGGTQADMRGAVQALNGTHAPAPATVLENEPTSSVILGGGIDAEDPPTVVQRPLADPVAVAKAMSAPGAPPVVSPVRTAPGALSPARHAGHATASGARASASTEADRLPKRSRLGLWLGLGAAGIGIVIGAWLAAGSGDKRDAAAPPVDTPVVTTASPIPPPPPPTETAQAVAPAPPAPPVQAMAPPPPPVAVTTEPAPRAAPPPVAAAPVAPPPTPTPSPRSASPGHTTPSWGGGSAPAPKAPSRPKGAGTTIVRDVPF